MVSLKKTFEQLNEQQQKAFQDASKAIDQLRDSIREPIKAALTISDQVTATINNIAFWANAPIVLRYTPEFVGPQDLQSELRIVSTAEQFWSARRSERPSLKGRARSPRCCS